MSTYIMSPESKEQSLAVTVPIIGVALLSLSACMPTEKDNLQSYIAQVKARPASGIQPLPEFKQVESFIYSIKNRRDPFNPDMGIKQDSVESTSSTTALKPDFNRVKEELESYPLDTLRMVGTLGDEHKSWALVMSQKGIIYRVGPGNYMGQNHGHITEITDEKIKLSEIVPDGRGGYKQHDAILVLAETSEGKKQ